MGSFPAPFPLNLHHHSATTIHINNTAINTVNSNTTTTINIRCHSLLPKVHISPSSSSIKATTKLPFPLLLSRRSFLLLLPTSTIGTTTNTNDQTTPTPPNEQTNPPTPTPTPTPPPPPPSNANNKPDTTITDRVFIEFSLCPTSFFPDRTLADSSLCSEPLPLGRVVIGLYGRLVPRTVSIFKSMCSGPYRGTVVHKILQGQYLAAGRQGRRDKNDVRPPPDLLRNTDSVDSKSFLLTHSRPGTISLCLSENDDDDEIKLNPDYRNVQFLITTGPGPCPQLDGRNIVFGTVLEGLDIVTTIAAIPTYKPAERIRQFNDFAEFLGDERAQIARATWDRPLKTVYISDCGEVKVTKPSLTPSLP